MDGSGVRDTHLLAVLAHSVLSFDTRSRMMCDHIEAVEVAVEGNEGMIGKAVAAHENDLRRFGDIVFKDFYHKLIYL